MVAAIDIHKSVFQAATLDPVSGEVADERFAAEPPQETTFSVHNQQTG